ncbi:receptor-type tyrosine-protein phosphatase S [Elysia marginata]|uniref:protein-tyrosine-phosphatase n=1 Tax=Elysia marginata TaxID=1093978 RepID=A0AAV4GY04_9GAST|nr:receptor-type tyrosine-protein phosphatase S [Elysia marginata]
MQLHGVNSALRNATQRAKTESAITLMDLVKTACLVTGVTSVTKCSEKCNQTCENGVCHHVNGSCEDCMPGYWGDFCDKKCNTTTHGVNCIQTCNATCLNRHCHHVTGYCHACVDSRTGDFCEKLRQGENGMNRNLLTWTAIGTIVSVLIVGVTVSLFMYRRRCQRKFGRAEQQGREDNGIDMCESPGGSDNANRPAGAEANKKKNISKCVKLPLTLSLRRTRGQDTESEESTEIAAASTSQMNPISENTAVAVGNLKTYILQHSSDSHFQDQFTSVPMTTGSPQTFAVLPENIIKNRYKNIIPYDTSRVLLQAIPGKKCSDYINASYVKSHKSYRAFIASQGPNDKMIDDFVRMLWEQKVDKVVMLTNLVEEGKVKKISALCSHGEDSCRSYCED